jgi:2-polyprenyl-3-methyl-5-hydroxy-6-metoxy-1,4-benzoquinol methylase
VPDDLIRQFVDEVLAENPSHRNFLDPSLTAMNDESRGGLLDYIRYCLARGLSLPYLANCYNTITIDTQMEQIYFRRHRQYRYSTFKEVAEQVYFDAEYMKKYMYGLALTGFLWPGHAAMQQFFVRTFPRGRHGSYLEIGPGHGYYFRQAAALGSFHRMIGVDISPASVELSRDLMRYHPLETAAEFDILEADFLQFSSDVGPFSCVVMGEVLEHVEEPGRFLRKIAELSEADAHIYVTTCLNAPAVDHIFLFSTLSELEDLARDSGLAIAESFVAPYAGKSIAECEAGRLPVNVAFVMRKR